MSIGFAVVSTTLIINGIISISENKDDFDIYFSSAMIDTEDYTNEIISKDKKTITYTSKELKKENDATTLTYEITNGSTQYDARGTVKVTIEENEYIEVENKIDIEKDIKAKETRTGVLTIRLKKGVTEAKEIPVKVELEYNAVEREEANKSAIKEDKYSISGYFVDNNGNALPNVNLAVYSEKAQFIKTDDHGYFYVVNLERGNHEIYYINESEVNKEKEEIKRKAIDKVSVTTSSENKIVFDKGYEVVGQKIVKEERKTIKKTLVKNNGEKDEEIELEENTLYKDIKIPEKSGYKFLHWKDEEGRIISEKTYVVETSENKLYAEYTEKEYTVNIGINNGSVSATSIKVIYGKENNLTVTPNSGYYISSGSCTNGYTISGLKTGTSATGSQTITIKNNSNASDSVCTIGTTIICPYTAGQVVKTFDYTGGIQSFTAACTGTYKLEVWGAQGGSATVNGKTGAGGKGGYSVGNKSLTRGTTLYVAVGGACTTSKNGTGSSGLTIPGGYNGGGTGYSWTTGTYMTGGGGATHIATKSGTLQSLSSNKSSVLIVAGGGGGGASDGTHYGNGGDGGGLTGSPGTTNYLVTAIAPGLGATQSAGGKNSLNATEAPGGFGIGGSHYAGYNGGGGGWYGGGGGVWQAGAGGGSGYIGGVTGGSMQTGKRQGHGYARITFVSLG